MQDRELVTYSADSAAQRTGFSEEQACKSDAKQISGPPLPKLRSGVTSIMIHTGNQGRKWRLE